MTNLIKLVEKQRSKISLSIARGVLCIPATSAPSERGFSTAGKTISAERANMLPENANDLVFLHDNYRAIPNIFEVNL